jgi:hypothetical protein
MEDHRGELILEDREGGGARVKLVFARGIDKSTFHPAQMETADHGA